MKILLIEDEKALAATILDFFTSENHICTWVQDLSNAYEKIGVYNYDCVIVDLMLPDGSGLKIIEQIKSQRVETGIVIISAKDALDDKIKGLDLGADDYITKPFHLSELNARLKSVMRRRQFGGNNEVVLGEIKIIPESKEVWIGDNPVVLTRKEFDLLMYLVANPNRVLTKGAISEHLYGDDIDQADSFDFLYSQIKNLRKKLTEQNCPDYIQSIYGVGYKFTLPK